MSDDGAVLLVKLAFIAIVVAAAIGFAVGIVAERESMQSQAIKNGYAHYHPTTGEWQWKPTPGATERRDGQ